MSNIICKPQGVQLTKKDAAFEMIFEEPYYIGLAYTDGKQIQIKKFKNNEIEAGWQELEKLTDYPLITFFEDQRVKQIEKNVDNLCPVILGDSVSAYVAAGEILRLKSKKNKQFTDVFYFKQFAFDKMEQMCPEMFFSYQGRWLMHRIIPYTSAVAFLSREGKFSIINKNSGYTYKKMWYFDTECVKTKSVL